MVAGGGGGEEGEEAKEKQEEGGEEEGKWVQHLNQEGWLPDCLQLDEEKKLEYCKEWRQSTVSM